MEFRRNRFDTTEREGYHGKLIEPEIGVTSSRELIEEKIGMWVPVYAIDLLVNVYSFFFYRSGYQIDAVLSFSVEIAESHFEIWRKLRKSNVRTILRGRCNYFSFFSRERTSGATTIATHSSSWILSDIEGQWLVWLAGRKILFPVPSSLPV